MDNHIAGNIYLNIIPKDMRGYKILDNFDLLYMKYIDKNEIINNSYSFALKHFDNENYNIEITNPIFGKQYIIENKGLYDYNSSKRNNLIIILLLNKNLENYTNITIKKCENIV